MADYTSEINNAIGGLKEVASEIKPHWNDSVSISYYQENIEWYDYGLNSFISKIEDLQKFFEGRKKKWIIFVIL